MYNLSKFEITTYVVFGLRVVGTENNHYKNRPCWDNGRLFRGGVTNVRSLLPRYPCRVLSPEVIKFALRYSATATVFERIRWEWCLVTAAARLATSLPRRKRIIINIVETPAVGTQIFRWRTGWRRKIRDGVGGAERGLDCPWSNRGANAYRERCSGLGHIS